MKMLRGLSGILPVLWLILILTLRGQGGPEPSTMIITQPEAGHIGNYPGRNMVISPDGKHLVYAVGSLGTGGQLFLRTLDEQASEPIPGTRGLWYSPFFSPDSNFIAFVTNGRQQKIRLPAGSPTTLFEVTGQWGGSWGPEDTIVYATDAGLFRIPAAGGKPQNLIVPDLEQDEIQYRMPEASSGRGDGALHHPRPRHQPHRHAVAVQWRQEDTGGGGQRGPLLAHRAPGLRSPRDGNTDGVGL